MPTGKPPHTPTPSAVDVRSEIDRFRHKLLDLTNNNRLLNYRRSRSRTIQIVDELPNQIFERLVIKEKPFSFLPRAEESAGELFSNDDTIAQVGVAAPIDVDAGANELPEQPRDNAALARRHTDDRLQTDLTEKSLDRVLNRMRQEAHGAIEETGVNYLYLALGMLAWRERDSSERTFDAPLLLIPVRFDRTFDGRANKYRVSVSYTGEDIQPNLCLTKRLENDFGLVLPEYADDDGALPMPDHYFARVSEAIQDKPNWRIRREALFGFFSFRKLLMYLDLDPQKWEGDKSPENHPIVRAVIQGTQIESSPHFFARDYEIDDNPVAQRIALVKDADSSQHSVLCDIAEGKNLVIEGPPGTGKSQTITNAIANALRDGRSVLFVAEKLAALEVVRSNLEKVNLGTFCLELHSEAANPREVFADLGRRLESTFSGPRELAAIQSRVEAQKTKLKSYLLACSLPAGPHGKPLYDVFWRIADLRSRGATTIMGAAINLDIDESAFSEAIGLLRELAAFCIELGPPTSCLWHGFFADRLLPSGQRFVDDALNRLREIAAQIGVIAAAIRDHLGGELGAWVGIAVQAPTDFTFAATPAADFDPSFARTILDADRCELACFAAREVRTAKEAWRAAESLVVDDIPAAESAANALAGQIARYAPKSFRPISLVDVRGVKSQLSSTLRAFQQFSFQARTLVELGFGPIGSLREFDAAFYKYRLVSHEAVAPPRSITESHFAAGAPATYQHARRSAEKIAQQLRDLDEHVYTSKVPNDDTIVECIDVLRAFGGSWTRAFRKQYRAARALIRQFAKPAARRVKDSDWIEVLETLLRVRSEMGEFEANPESLRLLGDSFAGLNTDWKSLELSLNWASTAKKAGLAYSQASSLREARWTNSAAPEPSDVSNAGRGLRQELSQAPLAACLGLTSEAIETSPLAKIEAFCTQWAKLVDLLLQHRGAFSVADDATVSDLIAHASQVQAAIAERSRLAKHDAYTAAFPGYYRGIDTDVPIIAATSQWLVRMREAGLPDDAIARMINGTASDEISRLGSQFERIKEHQVAWAAARESLARFGAIDEAWLTFPGESQDPFREQLVERLIADLPRLLPWAGFCRAITRCRSLGLKDFADALLEGRLRPAEAADAFDLTFHEQLASEVLEGSVPLRQFSRHSVEQVREEFQRLDRQLIELTQQEIASRTASRKAPQGVTTGRVGELTEMGLIRHEIGKQRRHCRIRDLVQRAGHAVQSLKPCFMMSPLSIAQFLPAGRLEFDLVVMDEASQIKPEDALGTLIRAKQIVVVGDPKQLPPTSFFDRMVESDEGDDATFLDDTESILEVSLKAFPHRRRLRWHYRSQHQSLIAFSNEKFYDGDLVVFPSPTTDAGRLGLRWHHVADAQFVGGCNPVEADAIASAIIRHAEEHPHETLGVAAFNVKQAQAIRDRLDEIAARRSDARLVLERLLDRDEPLFIKNLENVQGDERDVIFISYTYGPDPATGVVMNRFGPMTGENGWRRLNVLITRARRRVEVFSSMSPADIKAGPDKSRGVNAMKDYLQFAMTGELVDRGVESGRAPDSPFELAVARVVEGMGLRVVPQVGVAGYFVDLGVVHPDSPGEYLLGIECDGATYHSSKSARDRDRLREEVITARGWRLHRVWSTDWFLNQASEEDRLRAAISSALRSSGTFPPRSDGEQLGREQQTRPLSS